MLLDLQALTSTHPVGEMQAAASVFDPISTPQPNTANAAHLDISAQMSGQQHQGQAASFFAGAHHFVINNPTMTEYLIETGRQAIRLLELQRISGAEVDSFARHPPPTCHPDTRKELRGKIMTWVNDTQRHWRMLWLLGPAGVGKSAVAQTIAEGSRDIGRLGAAFFFSRLNKRNDPLRVIPTLAHQLAVNFPEYKRLITQLLAEDSTILEKNLRSQFKKLLIEPFASLKARELISVDQPLLIILDGLDECEGEEGQCEFIELISEHVHLMDAFPLLWMICSRPEWHLKRLLRRADFEIKCRREELFVDDPEAQEDVRHVLRGGFNDIRRRYWDIIDVEEDKPWPPETELLRLAAAASGLFIFASTVLKFIGDEDRGDPPAQLEVCLRFVSGSQMLGAINPLHALDLLYRRILSDIPSHALPTAMRILGFCLLNALSLPAQMLSNFYGLTQSTFYSSLRKLHSVMYIPPPTEALHQGLRFYHASFGDFLKEPSRSGQFTLNIGDVRNDVAALLLQWHDRFNEPHCIVPSDGRSLCCNSSLEIKWNTSDPRKRDDWFAESLHARLGKIVWDSCIRGRDEATADVIAKLCRFHFCHLVPMLPSIFSKFANWLYFLGSRNEGLIRLSPNCDTDHALLEKSGWPLVPAAFPLPDYGIKLSFVSLHRDHPSFHRPTSGMFFLGNGMRSCLVTITHSMEYIHYQFGDLDLITATPETAIEMDTTNEMDETGDASQHKWLASGTP